MEEEREREALRLQAELCHALADPMRLQILYLLGDGKRTLPELVEATGQIQVRVSQRLAALRKHGIVHVAYVGAEKQYRLADTRLLEACLLIREYLLDRLARQNQHTATPSL